MLAFLYVLYACLIVGMPVRLSLCPVVCLSDCLCHDAFLPVSMSVYRFVVLLACLFVCLFACLFACPYVCLSVFACLSVCVLVCVYLLRFRFTRLFEGSFVFSLACSEQ